MKIKQSIMFDVYDIADEALAKLKKQSDVAVRDLNIDVVIDAIFQWLDEYYLPDRMRWASTPPLSVNVFCKSLGVAPHDLKKNSGYQRAVNHLEHYFNEILADILPGRTWRALFIRRHGNSGFLLEIGEDYRIHWYMENVHKKQS